MPTKHPMRHLVIMLPGIMGSVLQKDGKDVWALSGQALWHYLRTFGHSFDVLRLSSDDWQQDTLGDGIVATRLIEDVHSIPGLVQHAGYGPFVRRIPDYFDVTEGSIFEPSEEANFFTYPYDWRRDNRVAARRLQQFIEYQLPRWRAWSGAQDAQVILLAHSMGGLISRYYLEVLGGWKHCQALITIGTPHRGSVNALDTLSNGIRKFTLDLSSLVRSFPSIYQLLPTYPVVLANGTYKRVAEMNIIPNVEQQRALVAREQFHEVIRQSALQNRNEPHYRQCTIPWIGTRQDTSQSAALYNGQLTASYAPPQGLDISLADGDGTVPRVSAVPPDLDGQRYERFAVEQHGWLTNNDMSLEPLLDTLVQLVASGAQNLYGGVEPSRPAINLRLDPVYFPDEPVVIRAAIVTQGQYAHNLEIQIDPVHPQGPSIIKPIERREAGDTLVQLDNLQPGLYCVEVRPRTTTHNSPSPVHGVFEVVGKPDITVE